MLSKEEQEKELETTTNMKKVFKSSTRNVIERKQSSSPVSTKEKS